MWYLQLKKKRLVLFLITWISLFPAILYAEEWQQVYSAEEPAKAVVSAEAPVTDKFAHKISLDYKDADLGSVLRSLAWTYGLNIVTSPDIKGKVTINLKDVTLKEALSAILAINGLAYMEREGIVYVSPGDPKTMEIQTEVIFLKYLPAVEAQDLLKKVISPKGDVKVNEISNSVIIIDFPKNIDDAKALLKKVDIAPQQVLIEAKIVDITSTDLAAIGVTYQLDYNPGHAIFSEHRTTLYPERLQGTITMGEQSQSLTGGQFSLNALTLKGFSATATIDALAKDGKAHLLASPSIAVLNGQEARIVIGERFPYKERTQTTAGTTETTKFVDIGTTLRVTPQINEDGYITMRIHPEVSSLYASIDAGPRITTREADTTVRIKEGETLIIAGLIKQKDERTKEGIPILGNIPIIGLLFSRRENDSEQKELAVFITPKILRSMEEKKIVGKRKAQAEDVYVTITKAGELSMVAKLFEQADHLEHNYGLESRRKDEDFRMNQALGIYEHIYMEFPESERAPEAMFYAARIYLKYYKDYKKAYDVFSRLISDYPSSPYSAKAKTNIERLNLLLGASKKEMKKRK